MKTFLLESGFVVIALMLASPDILRAQAEITVAGEGRVTVAPEFAEFNIGINRRNLSLRRSVQRI
jgi:hypothetical protein